MDLVRILRKTLILSSMALPLVLNSCKEENYTPEATLEINPKSGEAPLTVNMRLTGFDENGIGDIIEYQLNVNGKDSISDKPINWTKTFTEPGTIRIYGKVTDKGYKSDKTETQELEVYQGTYLDQSVELFNKAELKYAATLSKLSNAQLTINRQGTQFLIEQITDVNETGIDFTKIYTHALHNLIKGDYEFILKSGAYEKRTPINIPNYKPTANLNAVDIEILEESEKNVTLPKPLDDNPEDTEDAKYTSARSTDGKTQLALNGTNLNIKSLAGNIGDYQIELEFGSTAGGLEKAVLKGKILADTRIKVNPFIQPNDSTLNWYGSGDVTNNNIVDVQDLNRLVEILNGTYTNPADNRLMDRADVNGDGYVNSSDRTLLENFLNGAVTHLPGYWNLLTTWAERESWLSKAIAIDKTNETPWSVTYDCTQFSRQFMINFHGFKASDIEKLLTEYPYDKSNNGRFNIPVYSVLIAYYNSSGQVIGGHAMNSVILGDNAYIWGSLCNIEPQNDAINVQPGQYALLGENSNFSVGGAPVWLGGDAQLNYYFGFKIKDNIPTLADYENPLIKFISTRSK